MAWKEFFAALGLSKTESENVKVIYTNRSMFYAMINYQFETSELKNEEKLVKQRVQALKSYKKRLGMYIFVQSVKLDS